MDKLRLYFRLAQQSRQKYGQFYLPFILIGAGCAAMFYIMRFLCYSELPASLRGGEYVLIILGLGCIVVACTAVCILWYANRFIMRRREKELGLYNILGMRKGDVACVLVLETLELTLICTVAGLAGGVLFSKLALLGLLRLLNGAVRLGFAVCVPGLWQTAVLMVFIFALLLVRNLWTLWRSRPVELLHSENAGEREPKSRWLLALVGAVSLGGGYAIAILTKNPIQALLLFFVAVMLVILGTNCLFTAGSVVILKAMRKNKRFYYQPRNFTAVSGMLYRMKQNAKGLANICILCTMVLVLVSCTVCMYTGAEDALRAMYPSEIAVDYYCGDAGAQDTDFAPVEEAVRTAAEQYGCQPDQLRACLRIAFAVGVRPDGGFTLNRSFHGNSQVNSTRVLVFIDQADYARMTGEALALGQGQAAVYQLPGQAKLDVGGQVFTVAAELDAFPVHCDSFASQMIPQTYVVVADRAALQSLYTLQQAAYGENCSRMTYAIEADPQLADETMQQCAAAMYDAGNAVGLAAITGAGTSLRCSMREELRTTYGGFLFLGLFLGLLFLLTTVLMMYYKQLSEGYEDRARFVILQKVGMSEKEVRSTIRRQVLMIFFLPLLVAAIHVMVAFPMIVRLFQLFSLSNVPLFAVCTVVTLLVFGAGYVLVYLATACTYYQIVRA